MGICPDKTPLMAKSDLYKMSGHWDHYKEDMFPKMELDNESYVLRPMNCPHHMMIYKISCILIEIYHFAWPRLRTISDTKLVERAVE